MDQYTIQIIAKCVKENPEEVMISIALFDAKIGGKSIKGYLRYAAKLCKNV